MAGVRIRALTTPRLIKLTSTRCRSARQLNIGRRSTYQGGDSVQTTGATSPEGPRDWPPGLSHSRPPSHRRCQGHHPCGSAGRLLSSIPDRLRGAAKTAPLLVSFLPVQLSVVVSWTGL